MSLNTVTAHAPTRRPAFQWWWLIWVAASACVFLCGAALGMVSIGDPHGGAHWFAPILSPPFGGRDHVAILLVGVDDSEGRGLADTIIAAVVKPPTREISAISIPRDTRVSIPGKTGAYRINRAHSFGGLPLTIETAELLLGVPFDYYVEVSISGLVNLVDAAGGVDINVEKRMHYRDQSQNLLIDLQPGPQHLNGTQAMGYVRFRHDALGDLGRLQRQQAFLRAVAHQLLAPTKVTRLRKLARTFIETRTVQTNLSVADILALNHIVERVGPDAIRMATLPGQPCLVNGQSMLALDERQVQDTVDRILWSQGLTVSILNGTGVKGLGARAAFLLAEQGCDIIDVANAPRQTDTTLIIGHRSQAARAERVAAWLGGGAISVAPDGDNPADITVILGRDMEGLRQ